MSEVVLKILPSPAWREATADGVFKGSEVDLNDGFIHFSSPEQIFATAAKHFRGQHDLVVVAFCAADLGAGLRWEASRGGDLFPHLYGEVRTDLALWIEPAPLDRDGLPIIPERAQSC